MFRQIWPVFVAAGLLLGGCGGRTPLESTATLQVTKDAELPAPVRGVGVIGPLDTLDIVTFGVEELTLETVVDGAGRINFPLVGSLDVNGQTPAQVAATIQSGLRRYVRAPNVAVSVKEGVSQVVTVDGSVLRPGQYPATANTTLMRAIALGGGLSEFARQDDVVILRTIGDQRMAGLYNIAAIRRGAYTDPRVYPDDVIVVGDSPARRLFRDAVSVAPLAIAPLVAVLSRN